MMEEEQEEVDGHLSFDIPQLEHNKVIDRDTEQDLRRDGETPSLYSALLPVFQGYIPYFRPLKRTELQVVSENLYLLQG